MRQKLAATILRNIGTKNRVVFIIYMVSSSPENPSSPEIIRGFVLHPTFIIC